MSTTPMLESVEISDAGISITWKDGHHSVYSHRFLRLRCQCAHCVDEWTRAPRLDPEMVPGDIQAVDHILVGNYALQLLWNDTHSTGIYTFEFLRSVCTCMECIAKGDSNKTPS